MLKTTITRPPHRSTYDVAAATDTQRVMIVNGCLGILELIETILRAGRYDVVFVESNEHAYSQIKRLQPDLVILCVRLDHPDGFHVLSMLKLDEATRNIPLLTYATMRDAQDVEEEEPREPLETEMFAFKPMEMMN